MKYEKTFKELYEKTPAIEFRIFMLAEKFGHIVNQDMTQFYKFIGTLTETKEPLVLLPDIVKEKLVKIYENLIEVQSECRILKINGY